MRTTVDFAADVMREAKARAAERGESLKTLLTRAVTTELGRRASASAPAGRVVLPLFGRPDRPPAQPDNADLERAIADDDAATVAAPRTRPRPRRSSQRRR
jgi:hypothetical protein